MATISGLVVRTQSGFINVATEIGTLTCHLRGKLKRFPRSNELVVIGDRVVVTPIDRTKGVIDKVEPRQRMVARRAPTPQGEYQQIIIANPDQIVFVFACADPEPHLRMLDRFLVIAEREQIPPLIIANKVDLVGIDRACQIFNHYVPLGYMVVYTSAKTSKGIEEFKDLLVGKVSALSGPSGAGKSSLLNALQPGLGLAIRNVSQVTGKGKHTTVVSEMLPLQGGGYVADTPGLRTLTLWDINPEELDGYFPELRHLVSGCQFSDCTHIHEPNCAVREALDKGKIHPERYNSYVRLRLGDEG